MRSYSYTLGAGQVQQQNVPGRHFRVLESTGALYVSFNNGPEVKFLAGQGVTFDSAPFVEIRLRSLVAQSVLVVAGEGEYHDANENISVTSSATIAPGNTLPVGGDVSVAAISSVVISAAVASNLAVIIKADIANTETVRVGGSGVGAAGGYPLEPGESMTIATTAIIAAYNPSATVAQNIHVLPIRNI